ncbi:hypothetical protein [Streptomyces sp. ISL-94]|uniref:hypothetical protein n=1 Tax=Streptomyces sp. ISL-94 TaxID=2819190 RepID=UPI001BE5404B|nr:hypothetical protein [Streptomyces sp. ISL-94]MBT2478160.1 hypothetical protein [Streptomyces sp. ISL-94]
MKPQHVRYVLKVLIPFLEARAAQGSPDHRRTGTETWRARLIAAQAVRKSGQGGRGRRIHAASPGRLFGVPSHALQNVLPHEFVGRDEELAELAAFVAAPDGSPSYVWWQAGAWAGKTGLFAWFADRRLPAGVDVVHHFIAGRLGTNRCEDFVLAVSDQLASVARRKIPAAERGRPDRLPKLYEAAARASASLGRRLVLIVDGLDEDADAAPAHWSIAALLPKEPPHGMRVIVSGRPHPQVPPDVADGHPLRDPGIVRRLIDSPAARVIRDTALRELAALLDDPLVGRRLLGLLVAAQGALTGADMAELVGVTPYEVQKSLRSVVGRSMAPTEIDRLALGARAAADADAAAGRQTFVLAHEELNLAADEALGKAALDTYEQSLHAWADGYRDEGWPEDTPNYLLTGYTRLTQRSGNADRLADLVLDPRRQLRLVQRSGPDVALSDLALVASPDAGRTPPGLVIPAGAAVSRESLLLHARSLPRSVARTVARSGDVRRARALASAAPQAAARAVSLADVARVLGDSAHEQAGETAREAGEWARTALREAGRLGYATDETEAAAGQAALALLATGQVQAGLELLRSTRGSSTARYEAWAEAAQLLAPHRPESAAELLDDLEEEAADLAEERGDGSAIALQIWETVAGVAPDRLDRIHSQVLDHVRGVWEAAPTLQHVSVLAAAASALAQGRPGDAAHLVGMACRHVESVLLGSTTPMSAADAFHVEFGFRHTLARFSQALTDTGTPPEQVRRLLDRVEQALPGEPVDSSELLDEDEEDDDAERLAGEAFQLAGLGRDDEAKGCLDEALALLPMAGVGTGRAPLWLPGLAGALVRINAAEDVEELIDLWQDAADRARAHASVALAYADLGLARDARRHAYWAAQAVARSAPDGSPGQHDGAWAHAAQALACAGEGEGAAALYLIRKHAMPADRSKRAAWRRADRLARIAVAAERAKCDPQMSGELLLPLIDDLYAGRKSPRGVSALLARFAELLPAVSGAGHSYEVRIQEVMEEGLAYADKSPETWQPDTVLVHALLRIGAGEDPGWQVDWLTRDMANRGPEHFPTAGLAVVHTARGDIEAARRVAERPTNPRTRAVALTAVAGHLARVPVRPVPGIDPSQTDPFNRTIQNLALDVTSHAPADRRAATGFLHWSLDTVGWYHALPVLAQVEPEAVARVRDIGVVHARAVGGTRSD